MYFMNRADAGLQLAARLLKFKGQDGVVFALPRGGVILGAEVARRLGMSLDLVTARKIGHPLSSEYGIAAVTETGDLATNAAEIRRVDQSWFQRAVLEQQQEAHRRYRKYLGDRPRVPVTGKLAILVDDGIATGLTMEAAILQVRKHEPSRLVVAVPVVPHDTAARLRRLVDEVVAVDIPAHYLGAVGAYYEDFRQVSDDDVIKVLAEFYQESDAAWQRTSNQA